jgi:hypothetical protein
MQNNDFRQRIEQLALDAVWSLWVELGLSGWARRHQSWEIDLEPLILATSRIGELDGRLMRESLDWCSTNVRLISVTRLRNFLNAMNGTLDQPFGRYSTAVEHQTHVRWPGRGEPLQFKPSGKSAAPDLKRPALIQLRLRAVFGVAARAEIFRLMIGEPARSLSVAELSEATGYGKDVVADSLDLMSRAGVVRADAEANRRRFKLVDPNQFANLIGSVPTIRKDWVAVFKIMLTVLDFAKSAPSETMVRAVEITRLVRELESEFTKVGLASGRLATAEARVSDFEGLMVNTFREWAGQEATEEASSGASYSVHRLNFGGYGPWQAWIHESDGSSKPVLMPEWEGLYQEQPRSDTIISDDSTGAPRLAHAMFDDAFRRSSVDIGRYWSEDPLNQLICREFAAERLWPMYPGSQANFSESFLRSWYEDRKRRLSTSRPSPSNQIPG